MYQIDANLDVDTYNKVFNVFYSSVFSIRLVQIKPCSRLCIYQSTRSSALLVLLQKTECLFECSGSQKRPHIRITGDLWKILTPATPTTVTSDLCGGDSGAHQEFFKVPRRFSCAAKVEDQRFDEESKPGGHGPRHR
ncbi:uncharacterized protein LOC111546566 [Piliocolobus tephrosceles]|uniref:uncharacterized protein LOC111546566 n=1 Tax=Piliocolobus tephrosceles TaxID=591936 RepID=UPI000C298512|nr:uncharacterized protein LOC111546566 [Piliocolobus tephrosceles]